MPIFSERPLVRIIMASLSGGPHDLCILAGGRGGWMVGGTMNPSPSTDRQHRDFNRIFLYRAGTYTAGTRYLRGRY